MTITVSVNPISRMDDKEDSVTCTSQPPEKNLRSMLIKTISWRGFRKPENDSCNKSDPPEMTSQTTTEKESSSSLQSMHKKFLLSKKTNDSYHSFSSQDSFAGGDEKYFDWGGDDPSSEEDEQDTKQSINVSDDNNNIDVSIVLVPRHDESQDTKDDTLQQSWNSCGRQPTRHLKRHASRRRRRHNQIRRNSSSSGMDFSTSLESMGSVSTYDGSIDNISDSLDFGSSRHSVGRSDRRRTTHNRHLHQPHRLKQQQNLSTMSDPLSEFSSTSVLHKRLENNLKAQSQHSVSTRENPRYIVVKSDPPESEDRGRPHSVQEPRSKGRSAMKAPSIEHPRFIVVQSKPKDDGEKDEKHHSRRGRRRRTHSVEKTQSV